MPRGFLFPDKYKPFYIRCAGKDFGIGGIFLKKKTIFRRKSSFWVDHLKNAEWS